MAQNTGTFDTYAMKGIREDLADFISDVTPEEVPFQSNIGSERVSNTFTEWQIDSLAAASTSNKYIQGDQYSYTAPSATTRVGNYTQILRKTAQTTYTADAVDTAGRAREHYYQVVKRGRELRLDKEKIMLNNQASVAGTSTVASQMGGFPAWLETNAKRGTGGADGGYNSGTKLVDAATDSTTATRTFTETLLKDMLQDCWDNADAFPSNLYMSSFQKRKFSAFAGIAELRHPVSGKGQATIVGAADMYISDFGMVTSILSRHIRSREVLAVNHEYVTAGVLRPLQKREPAEDSDAKKTVIIEECTLKVKNEKAHGIIADLTAS